MHRIGGHKLRGGRKVPDRNANPYPLITGGVARPSVRRVSSIMRATTEIVGVSRRDLRSKSRQYSISHVRQMIYWIAWYTTIWAPAAIAMRFGRLEHSQVIHGVIAVNLRIEHDPKLARLLDAITRRAIEIDAEARDPISLIMVDFSAKAADEPFPTSSITSGVVPDAGGANGQAA